MPPSHIHVALLAWHTRGEARTLRPCGGGDHTPAHAYSPIAPARSAYGLLLVFDDATRRARSIHAPEAASDIRRLRRLTWKRRCRGAWGSPALPSSSAGEAWAIGARLEQAL